MEFLDAYTIWRMLPFPDSGRGPVLPDTKADLAGAELHVATVIRFVEKGIHKTPGVDVLGIIAEIRGRLTEFLETGPPEQRPLAREQHAYAVMLEIVYRGFLEQSPGT